MKNEILAAIGEGGSLPAASLNAALAANDRIKYLFSLLQMACAHAEHPNQTATTMKHERVACGIDDPALDGVIEGSYMKGKSVHVAGAATIMARIASDMHVMAVPVLSSHAKGVDARLEALLTALPAGDGDLLDRDVISAMTQADEKGPDSLHRLVMDLHKKINALQSEMAKETLDGAAVYGLDAADRPFVSAFMAGVNRTARLKFDHPGLATTATRVDGRLVIQNDIGTTDAHVIVIHVEGFAVSVTYTDVHAERLAFFKDMLKRHAVTWEGTGSASLSTGTPFFMTTGRIETANPEDCGSYLNFLGSRLVFLIDWNRARKQLRGFQRGDDRIALLGWAAEAEIGHRGFLELGGANLVNRAIADVAGSSMHFGDRLCDVLGNEETSDFLRFVFRTATEGMLSGQSHSLIDDRIRLTLAKHFSNEERQFLAHAADHAGLIFELAALVQEALEPGVKGSEKRTRHARQFEHDADRLVAEVRKAVRRRPDYQVYVSVLEMADDAADQLEEAVFLLGLDKLGGKPLEALRLLAGSLVEGAQEWIKAVGHAGQIGRAESQAETEDFIAAIDRIGAIEHIVDDGERALTVSAVKHAEDFRQLHLFTQAGGRLEAAADALRHASLVLHDHVFEAMIDD